MGRAAARDAARASLAPIVAELQQSAFALLDQMLPTVALETPSVALGARSAAFNTPSAPADADHSDAQRRELVLG